MISVCLGLTIAHSDLLLSLNLCIYTRLYLGQLADIMMGTAPTTTPFCGHVPCSSLCSLECISSVFCMGVQSSSQGPKQK